MIIKTYVDYSAALEFIQQSEILSYDVESDGLNVRKNKVIGFGISNGLSGFYLPIYSWNGIELVRIGLDDIYIKHVLEVLKTKKLLCWNASFDLRFTKNYFGVDLLPALHVDVMLLKHTCDEEFPFGLKEVGVKIYGQEAVQEQTALKASVKANGGSAKEFYKARTSVLAEYCVKDCLLTYRLYNYYVKELKRQGLENFYFKQEVLPLYKEVTIPLEETGIQLDVPLLRKTQQEITEDLRTLEQGIQEAIIPHLGIFTTWFLNKDYPLVTYATQKPSMWLKSYKTQADAWRSDNPDSFMFNLQSKHHLKKLFFDTLKEIPLSRTPTGQPQVNEEFLDSMALKYDWAASLITYNKLTKIKTAYVDRFLEEHEDEILYPSFMQHRTVSGRYGSDVQQLPKALGEKSGVLERKYTNLVRSFILPRADNVLLSADYAQLEPRVFCHVSGDEALRDIFVSGQDFYSVIGQRTEGLTEISKQARDKIKVYALGIPYGLTGYKLQFEIGCTQKQGDELVTKYFQAFPKLKEWFDASQSKAVLEGLVTTQTGRVRHLQEAKTLFDKYGQVILDDLRLWQAYHDYPSVYTEAKVARKTFKNLVNNSRNFQIQGLAASIINRAAIAVNRTLKANNLKARLVMQIHDELVYDVPKSEVETVSRIVQEAMENTTKLSVPLLAVPQIGTNYAECK